MALTSRQKKILIGSIAGGAGILALALMAGGKEEKILCSTYADCPIGQICVEGVCSECESDSDCPDNDWFDAGETRWINSQENECVLIEQAKQEYREYECVEGSCNYIVTAIQWIDTGRIQDNIDGVPCFGGQCHNGACVPTWTIETCDFLTDWNINVNATPPTIDTLEKIDGSASINMGKIGVSNNYVAYSKAVPYFNVEGKYVRVWAYIYDVNEITRIIIKLGSGNAVINSYSKTYDRSELLNGWNLLGGKIPDDFTILGNPGTSLNFLRFIFYTPNASDLIASGNLKMDWWYMSTE